MRRYRAPGGLPLLSLLLATALSSGPAAAADAPATTDGDAAVVIAPAALVVEGLKDTYAAGEDIAFKIRVPKADVVRAETEVLVLHGRATGTPIFREVKAYDRFTVGDTFPVRVALAASQQTDELTLLVRVTGLEEDVDGELTAFEEHFTYNLAFDSFGGVKTETSVRYDARLLFASNKYALTARHIRALEKVAAQLRAEPALDHVLVEGHADHVGSADYNVELSRKRALSAVDWLVAHGVSRTQVRHIAFGFSHPYMEISEAAARRGGIAENRRVEFVVFRTEAAEPAGAPE